MNSPSTIVTCTAANHAAPKHQRTISAGRSWLPVLVVLAIAVSSVHAQEMLPDSSDQPAETTQPDGATQPADNTPQPPDNTASPGVSAPGVVVLADDFSDPQNGSLPSGRVTNGVLTYLDGEYQIAKTSTGNPWTAVEIPGTYADSSVAVDVRFVTPLPSVGLTIGCRSGGSHSYFARVQPVLRTAALVRFEGDNLIDLVPDTPQSSLQPGASNHVELSCIGTTISLLLNGQLAARAQDATYASGTDYISAGDTTGGVADARLGHLVVTQPADTTDQPAATAASPPAASGQPDTVTTQPPETAGQLPAPCSAAQTQATTSTMPGRPLRPTPRPGPGQTTVVPVFCKPFGGERGTATFFDHELPVGLVGDTDGSLLTWWGLRVWPDDDDGHNGYDWAMPEGTPLLAVAPGVVVLAGHGATFDCPALGGRETTDIEVDIEHQVTTSSETLRVRTRYDHLSRVDVQVGQKVMPSDQIGLSGLTGCTGGPHVHFQTDVFAKGRFIPIDPYGWEGTAPDPWAQDPRGAPSIWLWQDGQAPGVSFLDQERTPNSPAGNAPVAITFVRWLAVRDDQSREQLAAGRGIQVGTPEQPRQGPDDRLVDGAVGPRLPGGGLAPGGEGGEREVVSADRLGGLHRPLAGCPRVGDPASPDLRAQQAAEQVNPALRDLGSGPDQPLAGVGSLAEQCHRTVIGVAAIGQLSSPDPVLDGCGGRRG